MQTRPKAANAAHWRRCAAALLGMTAMSVSVAAELSYANMFRTNVYMQTSDAGAGYLGSFLSASVAADGPTGAASGVLTVPTSPSSTQTLDSADGIYYQYQTGLLASQAAMDAAFPTGSYGFEVAAMNASFAYAGDHYAGSAPALSGSSYSSLQNVDAGSAVSLTFSPFDAGTGASKSLVFFTIYDQTAAQLIVNEDFGETIPSGFTIAAGVLAPGHAYTFDLVYSNRLDVPAPGTFYQGQIGYDQRTLGDFSTLAAVPEPTTLALWAAGVLLLGACAHRRAARAS